MKKNKSKKRSKILDEYFRMDDLMAVSEETRKETIHQFFNMGIAEYSAKYFQFNCILSELLKYELIDIEYSMNMAWGVINILLGQFMISRANYKDFEKIKEINEKLLKKFNELFGEATKDKKDAG